MKAKQCDGCLPDEEIGSYVFKAWHRERIRDIAWWERREIKDVAQEMANLYLASKADVPERKKA